MALGVTSALDLLHKLGSLWPLAAGPKCRSGQNLKVGIAMLYSLIGPVGQYPMGIIYEGENGHNK